MPETLEWGSIKTEHALESLSQALLPLKDTQIEYLRLPLDMAAHIEPSQIGTIVGTITDMALPRIALEKGIGLTKSVGLLGDREGYPDFEHSSGYRIELKGVFKDNPAVNLKKPPTPREPSARLTQKVTVKNVIPDRDALLILVYQLDVLKTDPSLLSPTIVGIGLFPAIECVLARDARMEAAGGRWFGNYETPTIPSKIGRRKIIQEEPLNIAAYGRKESEGLDFNEDTNFGKMKRIPYRPLQEFLRDNGCQFAATGCYPALWRMSERDAERALALEMLEAKATDT